MAEELDEKEYDPGTTAFAAGGCRFMTEIFNLEYMAPGTHASTHINGYEVKISRETFDIIVLLIAKDNMQFDTDDNIAELREEVLAHYQLKASLYKTINELTIKGAPASAYSLKCLREELDRLCARDKEMNEKKKYLLHKTRIGMADDFYKDEWLNDPSEYDPDSPIKPEEPEPRLNKRPGSAGKKTKLSIIKKILAEKHNREETLEPSVTDVSGNHAPGNFNEDTNEPEENNNETVPGKYLKFPEIKNLPPELDLKKQGKTLTGCRVVTRTRKGKLTSITKIEKYS